MLQVVLLTCMGFTLIDSARVTGMQVDFTGLSREDD